MNRWSHIDRTAAGRPVLTDNEVILFVQNSVGLYDGSAPPQTALPFQRLIL